MKNKTTIIILIIIVLTVFQLNCYTQNIDSLINSQPISKTEQVNILKELLNEAINSENPDVVLISNLQNYWNKNFDEKYYQKLSFEENCLLSIFVNLLSKNWDTIFNIIDRMSYLYQENNAKEDSENNYNYRMRGLQNFLNTLSQKSNTEQIYNEILNSELSTEKKDFLKVFLQYFFSNVPFADFSLSAKIRNELFSNYKKFKKDYPKSKYINYFSLYEYKLSNFQFEWNIRIGIINYTKNLRKNVHDPNFIMEFEFDVYYKKLFFGAYYGIIGTSSLRKDIEVYKKDSFFTFRKGENSFSGLSVGINTGYDVIRTRRFVLSPTIGFNTIFFDVRNKKESEMTLIHNSLQTGINVKYLFKRFGYTRNGYCYWGINLSYRYNCGQIFKNNVAISGDLHTITIALFLHFAKYKKIKI